MVLTPAVEETGGLLTIRFAVSSLQPTAPAQGLELSATFTQLAGKELLALRLLAEKRASEILYLLQ